MNSKISVEDFCEKHDVSANLFYQFRYRNKDCAGIHKEPSKKNIWINEKWFTNRQSFKEKVYQANQNLYYALKEMDIPIARAVEYLAKKTNLSDAALNTHLSSNIWVATTRNSILSSKIGLTYWIVYIMLARYDIEEILKKINDE